MVADCYRLTPWFILYRVQTSYLMQLELFFKIGYVCTIPKGVEWNRTAQFAVLILCHDSTGCDEMG